MKLGLAGGRWLRLRHDWPVRWAHHPVCARHAGETWRIGRLYLCRGCASMAFGLVTGTAAVLTVGGDWCVWALAGVGLPVVALSWPVWYRRLPRILRDALRAGAGLMMALLAWTVASYPGVAWPLLPALALLWWWFRSARMRVLAARCHGCPELNGVGVCSGYALHADLARAMEAELEQRLAGSLSGAGALPAEFAVDADDSSGQSTRSRGMPAP